MVQICVKHGFKSIRQPAQSCKQCQFRLQLSISCCVSSLSKQLNLKDITTPQWNLNRQLPRCGLSSLSPLDLSWPWLMQIGRLWLVYLRISRSSLVALTILTLIGTRRSAVQFASLPSLTLLCQFQTSRLWVWPGSSAAKTEVSSSMSIEQSRSYSPGTRTCTRGPTCWWLTDIHRLLQLSSSLCCIHYRCHSSIWLGSWSLHRCFGSTKYSSCVIGEPHPSTPLRLSSGHFCS